MLYKRRNYNINFHEIDDTIYYIIIVTMANIMDNANESDIIKLNVGGVIYTTTKTTLCQPGSWFETMFSGKMKPGLQIDGSYFIDRNGKMFDYVLDYLRNLDRWIPPVKTDTLSKLVNEAHFFCLEGMLDKIKEMVPTDEYTFEVYIQQDKMGTVSIIGYSGVPVYIKSYLDSLTITQESAEVTPPMVGFVRHLIPKLDGRYRLYYQSTLDVEGRSVLVFVVDPKHIGACKIKENLGLP